MVKTMPLIITIILLAVFPSDVDARTPDGVYSANSAPLSLSKTNTTELLHRNSTARRKNRTQRSSSLLDGDPSKGNPRQVESAKTLKLFVLRRRMKSNQKDRLETFQVDKKLRHCDE
jgi:hypothetical protein